MYKLLLSSRYLRTRFIALASIISVMLGVATMIVVNSVMAGFSSQMKDRLHGILADLMVESTSSDGFDDPQELIAAIQAIVGDRVEAITPAVEIYGMMTFDWNETQLTQPVTIVGILPQGKDLVSPLREYLMSRQALKDEGKVIRPPLRDIAADLDWELTEEGIKHRAEWLDLQRMRAEYEATKQQRHNGANVTESANTGAVAAESPLINPFDAEAGGAADEPAPHELFGPSQAVPTAAADRNAALPARVYIGCGLVSYPYVDANGKTKTMMLIQPGEDVKFTTVTVGNPEPARFAATYVDAFKSGMSEYDGSLAFCNLAELQFARKMLLSRPTSDDDWTKGSVTSLQIKLKNYDDAEVVVQQLLARLPGVETGRFQIRTWEQKQGPLLQAVEVESAILNVLLFLIIAVAGFGILAIFYMIVVEKTRDIGILKALGAGSGGVMSIFLAYGLGLGVVGSGVGVMLGLVFVWKINEIEDGLSWFTGRKVFDEAIYYFDRIPTDVHPGMVLWVAFGAMAIAVLASVLPARRAARLDPVQALRYE
ncbi:MAG: FtsX-like permease family protein [Planctomycetaceae bacterium]